MNHKKSEYNSLGDYYCHFCQKHCHNVNSLKQHEVRCRHNPNRIKVIRDGFNNKGKTAWNEGLTKQTSPQLAEKSLRYKANYKAGKYKNYGHPHSEEYKQHLSTIARDRQFGGFNMRKKGIIYNDIKLDSSYEVILAQSLDANNIKWSRCKRFPYKTPSGKLHYYTPDFYLPDFDIYLDPKNDFLIHNINPNLGYKDSDKIKWVMEYNNITVLILNSKQLDWNIIKTLI